MENEGRGMKLIWLGKKGMNSRKQTETNYCTAGSEEKNKLKEKVC